MNRSVFSELYYKVFQSGDRLYLFMGINILLYVLIGIVTVAEWLFTGQTPLTVLIKSYISMPASLSALMYKPWTPITYMFGHDGIFHILFNMLWLYWMGRIFSDFLNKRQFTFTYLAGGIVGAVLYLLAYNTFPVFRDDLARSVIIGSSASVMAIVVATATLLPDYSISLLFFGNVKLKFLALIFIVIDFISIAGSNAGGSIGHLGGAFLGFIFIKNLQNGHDWSKIAGRRRKLRVVQKRRSTVTKNKLPDQELIDTILDKISRSGYNSLTKDEKEQLFNASKQE